MQNLENKGSAGMTFVWSTRRLVLVTLIGVGLVALGGPFGWVAIGVTMLMSGIVVYRTNNPQWKVLGLGLAAGGIALLVASVLVASLLFATNSPVVRNAEPPSINFTLLE